MKGKSTSVHLAWDPDSKVLAGIDTGNPVATAHRTRTHTQGQTRPHPAGSTRKKAPQNVQIGQKMSEL